MELVPTLSRRDRLHIAMRRQHLDNDAITTDNGKTLTPNNNLTTNAASLGSNRSIEVERDVSVPHCQSWDCVVYRKINGTDVVPKSLRVNGNIVVPLPLPSKT